MKLIQTIKTSLIIGLVSVLAACGGGGGGGDDSNNNNNNNGNNGNGGNTVAFNNKTGIQVVAGPGSVPNIAYVSVEVCAPGSTTNCQFIDHVQLDTGSSGLRLVSGVLNASLSSALGANTLASGRSVAQCMQFGDGFTWGSTKIADVKLGDETSANTAIQIIGDPAYATVPSDCLSNGGSNENTATLLGANGILGISTFVQDCGAYCTSLTNAQIAQLYFSCDPANTNTCVEDAVPLAQQVSNPVAGFGQDSNGTIITLGSPAATGSSAVSGTVYFGIGTRTNNALSGQQIYTTDANGLLTTNFLGATVPSFIDSGSSALFFTDSNIPQCAGARINTGFYCPAVDQNLSANIAGTNGTNSVINFTVSNALNLLSTPGLFAYSNLAASNSGLAGSLSSDFDWGLPFYYGRNVVTITEGATVNGTTGPAVGF